MNQSYKALWSHNFVPADEEHLPEIATNEEWRAIMVRARKAHKLTQDQLGEDVGTTQVMISKIESGVAASSKFVLPICRRLSIPEPMNFADEAQKEWSQLGHLLRHKGGAEYEATLQLLRSMAKRIEDAAVTPDDAASPGDRRK